MAKRRNSQVRVHSGRSRPTCRLQYCYSVDVVVIDPAHRSLDAIYGVFIGTRTTHRLTHNVASIVCLRKILVFNINGWPAHTMTYC